MASVRSFSRIPAARGFPPRASTTCGRTRRCGRGGSPTTADTRPRRGPRLAPRLPRRPGGPGARPGGLRPSGGVLLQPEGDRVGTRLAVAERFLVRGQVVAVLGEPGLLEVQDG